MTQDEADVRAMMQQKTDSWLKRDADGVMDLYWNSPELMTFDILPPMMSFGWEEGMRTTVNFRDGCIGPVEMRCLNPHVIVADDGKHAYSYGVWELKTESTKYGKMDFQMRQSSFWKKMDGRWKVVHEHNSMPLDKDNADKYFAAKFEDEATGA